VNSQRRLLLKHAVQCIKV